MNQQQVVSEDYQSAAFPSLTALPGVRALDMSTGILYQQTAAPYGKAYKSIGKYYYQPIATGGGSPTGPAGGALAGTYPNPDLAAGAVVGNLGFTPENVANKATDLTSPDNTKYPTTLAVSTAIAGAGVSINKTMAYIAAY